MLIRTISGAVFTAIITGFFLLREFVDYRLFAILLWFLCAVGTMEVSRAIKEKIDKIEYVCAIVLGSLVIPFFVLMENYISQYALTLSISFILLIIIISLILIMIFGNKKKLNFLPYFYPSLLILLIAKCNYLGVNKGFLALILIFVLSPLTDTFAYIVGMIYNKIRKGKAKKLCPKLSPKKTIAGAIGGVFGGIVGALLVYFIFKGKVESLGLDYALLFFIIVGVVASVFTQIGDLFESYIKRSVGIKDMGKIMPGHGGVMDRIDGITFAGAFIYILFAII